MRWVRRWVRRTGREPARLPGKRPTSKTWSTRAQPVQAERLREVIHRAQAQASPGLRALFEDGSEPLHAAPGQQHLVALFLEKIPERFGEGELVLDDEQAHTRGQDAIDAPSPKSSPPLGERVG